MVLKTILEYISATLQLRSILKMENLQVLYQICLFPPKKRTLS